MSPPSPYAPVADVTLPQTVTGTQSFVGVLIVLVGLLVVGFLCCTIWSGAIAASSNECPDEPPRYKQREHLKWQEECQRRQRRDALQTPMNTANDTARGPAGSTSDLRVTLGLGGRVRQGWEEERLLS